MARFSGVSARHYNATHPYPTGRRAVVWAPIAGRCAQGFDATFWERLVSGLPLQARIYRRLGSDTSDGVVLISSQLNTMVPLNDGERIFGSHQHSEAFPDLNVPESMSPFDASGNQPGIGERIKGWLDALLDRRGGRVVTTPWFSEGLNQ